MAVKRDDPYTNDPYASDASNDDIRRRRAGRIDDDAQRFNEDLQADPELAEGPASGGRMALFAIAIIAILGVVFYGLNNPSIAPTSTAETTTTAPSTPTPPPPAQTTGSATSTQTSPPAAGDNANGNTNSGSSSTPSMTPAPSPSNGGTTQSGPPANN